MKIVMQKQSASMKSIQQLYVRTQLVLIISLALMLGIAGILLNIHFENIKRDQNLQNIAEAIASSPLLTNKDGQDGAVGGYLDILHDTLDNIDVISVVNAENIRVYHSNPALIGTVYDGNLPDFEHQSKAYYAVDETGPSGSQRRAYAVIRDSDGAYAGFVMAIMLTQSIHAEVGQILLIFFLITLVAVLIELAIASRLSEKFKERLLGYEPDVFAAMFQMRDNILEALEEGILAVDNEGVIQFANRSAVRMLCADSGEDVIGKSIEVIGSPALTHAMKRAGRELNISLSGADMILDRVPIREGTQTVGAIGILHDRAEYTKLMEDLSGTRFLVDSMRANNHDFTNKLHVILGLLQMQMYSEATSYIQNITMVQRENISRVMNAVAEPAVAALLIGKIARASELNIRFVLRDGCRYSPADRRLPPEMLITVIGNLLDNAFDAMNDTADFEKKKELLFGIYSKPDAVLITVDDNGHGISQEALPKIFDNGYSTKGSGRGTGLYQVKMLVENFGGTITVESQQHIGASFCVKFSKEREYV